MINWIKSLFKKCDHEWKFVRETDHYDIFYGGGRYPEKTTRTYMCHKCLKTKIVRI